MKQPQLNKALLLVGLFIAGAFQAMGCAPSRMLVPPNLAQHAEVYPVNRPSFTSGIGTQTYQFGAYTAKNVDLGVTSTRTTTIGVSSKQKSKQKFTFELEDDRGAHWIAACESSGSEKSKALGGGVTYAKGDVGLDCTWTTKEGTLDATLSLSIANDGKEGQVIGSLEADEKVEIRLTQRLEGSSLIKRPASGYLFYQNGTEVGAVDVVPKGVVYLSPTADPKLRFALAAAAVALIAFSA